MTAFDEAGLDRVRKRMDYVDAMSPDLRACVHEFGLTIVKAMIQVGITNPRHIRHLVASVREGSIELGNRTETPEMKEDLARRYARKLRHSGFLVVPEIPSKAMVQASIDALYDAGIEHARVDRKRKHTVRLIYANLAGHTEHITMPKGTRA